MRAEHKEQNYLGYDYPLTRIMTRIRLDPKHAIKDYHVKNSTRIRHATLQKAINRMETYLKTSGTTPSPKKCHSLKVMAHTKVMRRLMALAILDRYRYPEYAEVFLDDAAWIRGLKKKLQNKLLC
jgi:hypothetical protein